MKIEVNDNGELVLKEIYSGITLETSEGNQLCICMRDDTFEFSVVPNCEGVVSSHRINMQTGKVDSQ